MNKDSFIEFIQMCIFWGMIAFAIFALFHGREPEETNVIPSDAFTEQCQHYHYGPDQTRNCMDKFLIRK